MENNQTKTESDITSYFEIARIAMAVIPEDITYILDISDDEFIRLREELHKITETPKYEKTTT